MRSDSERRAASELLLLVHSGRLPGRSRDARSPRQAVVHLRDQGLQVVVDEGQRDIWTAPPEPGECRARDLAIVRVLGDAPVSMFEHSTGGLPAGT